MESKIRKCDSCGIDNCLCKPWRTGAWLCYKCFDEYKVKESSNTSISESVVKKIKKGRNKKRRNLKNVKTKLHEDGFQSRLNVIFE